MVRRMLMAGVALLAALTGPFAAEAQPFPNKPITLIVPFAAGGPSDAIGRLVGARMSENLGQQIVIENVAGAGGTTAAGRAARSAPDGYTVLIHHVALAAAATLYPNLPYETLRDFEPIGLVNQGPYILTSRLTLETRTLADVLAHLRANRERVSFGHAGLGSGSHLCNMLLQSHLGFKFNEIPYRGTGPAMNDLVAGQLDFMCDQTTNTIPQIQGARIRPYAVTALTRIPQMPELPTMHESGMPNFEVGVWHALYAPRGTPAAVVERLNQAMEFALADPTVRARFSELGTVLFPDGQRGPAATRRQLESEVARWARVIREAGVTISN